MKRNLHLISRLKRSFIKNKVIYNLEKKLLEQLPKIIFRIISFRIAAKLSKSVKEKGISKRVVQIEALSRLARHYKGAARNILNRFNN